MNEITLREYLLNCSQEELTEHLMNLDASIMSIHQKGYYIVGFDANNIMLNNGELSLSSFNNKLDYLNKNEKDNFYSGLNPDGDKKDILEMCAIGICAYNGFTNFYTSKECLANLIVEFDRYCNNGNVPSEMVEYYQDVLINGNVDYLNSFMSKKKNANANPNQIMGNSNRLSKSTAIGRAFDNNREAAYVSVLILPALMVLIYFVMLMVLYFVDK